MKNICVKIGIAFAFIGVLTFSLIYSSLNQFMKSVIKNQLESAALDVVQKDPEFLDAAFIDNMWSSGRYWEAISLIDSIAHDDNVQNIYFIDTTRKPWTILWALDYYESDFPPEKPYFESLYAYTDEIPADLQRAVDLRTRIFTEEPYTDKWGTFISLFKPVMAADGRMTGILGVDKRISEVHAATRRLFLVSLFPLIAFVAAGLILILYISTCVIKPIQFIKKSIKSASETRLPEDAEAEKYKRKDNDFGEITREIFHINKLLKGE